MAAFFLMNTVFAGGALLQVGKRIDATNYDTTQLTNAGAVLWPATDATVAAAAAVVQQRQQSKGINDVDASIFLFAVALKELQGGGGGGGAVPLGTGFYHVVAGVMDANAKAVDLATADVTGVLGAANIPALLGDVTGSVAATVVAKINGSTVPAGGALTTGNALQVTGAGALSYAPVNLAGGANFVTGALPLANSASPTGTGLAKVSAGAWVGASATLVDADVNAAAAIAGSKISPSFVGVVISDTAFRTGTNPAATGAVRLAKGSYLVCRNAGNTADLQIAGGSLTGDNAEFGDPANTNNNVFQVWSGGSSIFKVGGGTKLSVVSLNVLLNVPAIGDSGTSSPYGLHGCATVAGGDAPYTEVAANYAFANLIYTGALTAGRTYTFPAPASLAKSYAKSIFNNTTGGFAITVSVGAGTTVDVAAGKTAILHFDSTGVRRLTADV